MLRRQFGNPNLGRSAIGCNKARFVNEIFTHARTRTRPYCRSATKRNVEQKRKEKRRRCAVGREKHIFIASHAPLDYIGALLKCGRIACQVQY